ncbi:MAG TPA: hypothetical protein DCP90_08605 [Clostridiales bacterium]|nr:MAG: hypothetical protein A2Y22_05820 [Clostridiales bacterium GWD2_32_59]HAN10654.1 hypothetical protein [Clostridiales bacterium]
MGINMKKSGYITVEASIIMPFVICIILSFAYFIKILYIEQIVKNAMYESGIQFSRDIYFYNKVEVFETGDRFSDKLQGMVGFIDKFSEDMGQVAKDLIKDGVDESYNNFGIEVYKNYFIDYINTQENKYEYLKGKGIENLDFSNSILSKDELYINITYEIKNVIPIDFIGSIKVSEGLCVKTFADGQSLYALSNNIERVQIDFDVWELSNFQRGKKIAEILGNNLGNMYYGIDRLENKTLESIVSVDTRKKTYLNEENLYDRVKEKIDEIYIFEEGSKNGIVVKKSDYNKKVMNLVLPSENMTQSQQSQLEKVRRYAKNKNIIFKITIVEKGN